MPAASGKKIFAGGVPPMAGMLAARGRAEPVGRVFRQRRRDSRDVCQKFMPKLKVPLHAVRLPVLVLASTDAPSLE